MATFSNTNIIKLVVWYYTRENFESKYSKRLVPVELKHQIANFSKRFVTSCILTRKENLKFTELLVSKFNLIKSLKLLYRASENSYCVKKFHKLCDNKGATITIIQSNFGNVFGGYTRYSWTSPASGHTRTRDEKAFLFLIRSNDNLLNSQCPITMSSKGDLIRGAIGCASNRGPWFGCDIVITSKCNAKIDITKLNDWYYCSELSKSCMDQFASYVWDHKNITGSNIHEPCCPNEYFFEVVDYEVFKIDIDNGK